MRTCSRPTSVESTPYRTNGRYPASLMQLIPLHLCFGSAPKRVTDRLQSVVLNAAARLITGTQKYERGLMHDDLNWLIVPQRLHYKLAVTVNRCLQHRAPRYLADYCVPVSEVPSHQHLRSARRHQLTVPRVCCSTFGSHAFFVTGPTVWNSLPNDVESGLHDPAVYSEHYRRDMKTPLGLLYLILRYLTIWDRHISPPNGTLSPVSL